MGTLCVATDPASHFCTLQEIENAAATTGVAFSTAFSSSWMDYLKDSWSESQDINYSGWNVTSTTAVGDVIPITVPK
jgi:hypothetical protein